MAARWWWWWSEKAVPRASSWRVEVAWPLLWKGVEATRPLAAAQWWRGGAMMREGWVAAVVRPRVMGTRGSEGLQMWQP